MKQIGNYIIAEPGRYLVSGSGKGLKMLTGQTYSEIDINSNNIKKVGSFIFVDNLIAIKNGTHAEMKTALIKILYSNDDQIAIMLNGNQEDMDFMQSWRDYFSDLLHIIENTNFD